MNRNSNKMTTPSKANGFGTAKRYDIIKNVKINESILSNPGPGSYSISDGIARTANKTRPSTANKVSSSLNSSRIPVTRDMSTINREHLSSPGPGMYDASK